MTDIFIKTYPGDFIWLEFCIRSIEKFVTGFRDIVIVTDSGTELKIDSNLPIKIFYEDLPNETHPCPVGIGYAWAQSVKLNWTKYTDANYILQIDSDTMFTDKIDMSYYHIDGKFKWFYREWSEAGEGIIHRVPTDFFIKRESTRDHMPAPTWFFSRKTTELFQNWINENWGGIWNYLNVHARQLWTMNLDFHSNHIDTHKGWGSCEYHMYGNFIEFFYPEEYQLVHSSQYGVPIRQSWSWGGLKEDEIKFREELLNK